MESWSDQAIVLHARLHGEGGAIVSVLSENNGRCAGYVHGVQSSKNRASCEVGAHVSLVWSAKNQEQLGSFKIELEHSVAPDILFDKERIVALQSACALCHEALPEREGHAGLYHGLRALFDLLQSDSWAPAYIMWEMQFLRELGFSLDLSRCAGGGDASQLAYISPKTGRAVSLEKAQPYKDRLLPLPEFLKPTPDGEVGSKQDIALGLTMTGYFLEHWAFVHHTRGVPDIRERLRSLFV